MKDNQRPGCSIVAFTIELIHHSWDTNPVEGFKYSSSSLATDNMVRYGVQPRFLEVYTDRASIYMNKVLMVWHGSSSSLSDAETKNVKHHLIPCFQSRTGYDNSVSLKGCALREL
ncbi:hypothetical protein LOTGIDRAFT_175331 [Lottia gigantea]|uniref:Uncharacterized protein n=1 Tax=Lottia gigantea TaxID=225164 RepID=V4AJJ5_LOTGI|nr:hypothetical protein LOTGIDRAFT_175331 [Lottia gigantea]ESO94870.1 hypothetical protein LOTGIDRAFT_175331 [Lottia gigantea]